MDRKKITILLFVLCCIVFGVQPVEAGAATEAKGNMGSFTWQLDTEGVLRIEGSGKLPSYTAANVPWKAHKEDVKKVVFGMSSVSGGDLSNYFQGCSELRMVNNIPKGVTKMNAAFRDCVSLTSLGMFPDTLLEMKETFQGCKKFNQELTVPAHVKSTEAMFRYCTSLTYTPKFAGDAVEDIANMFEGTAIVHAPELPSGIVYLTEAFMNCNKLREMPAVPAGTKDMNAAFYGCGAMVTAREIPVGVEDLAYCFYDCCRLTETPEILTDKVTDMSYCFYRCSMMKTAPVIPKSVKNLNCCFYECSSMKNAPDVPPQVQTMRECFAECVKVSGTMAIYAEIKDASAYYRFAGVTQKNGSTEFNRYLGAEGSGITVNYTSRNESLILKYLSNGWSSDSLESEGKFGRLQKGTRVNFPIFLAIANFEKNHVYSGQPICPEPELTFAGNKLVKGTDYRVTWSGNINAGTAYLNISGNGAYQGKMILPFTIAKASFRKAKGYDYSGVYDGRDHTITIQCDEGALVEYGTQEGQYSLDQAPVYQLPGKYTVYFRISKANYETVTGSALVTITPASLEVYAAGYYGVYDKNPHGISISVNEGALIRYGTKSGVYTESFCPVYINAGTYTIYFEITKTGYKTYRGSQTVVILKQKVRGVSFPKAGNHLVYGQSLAQAGLSFANNECGSFAWMEPKEIPVVNNEGYVVVFTPFDSQNYDYSGIDGYQEDGTIRRLTAVSVQKAVPQVEEVVLPPVPYEEGMIVGEIVLPSGWSWADETVSIQKGAAAYEAIYTPEDTDNYEILSGRILVEATWVEPTPPPTAEPVESANPSESAKPSGEEPGNVKPSESAEPSGEEPGNVKPSESAEPSGSETGNMAGEYFENTSYEHTISSLLSEIDRKGKETVFMGGNEVRMPGRVKISRTRRKGKKVTVIWKKVGKAAGYQVAYSAKKKKKGQKKKVTSKTRLTFRWAKRKKCYVRVRAYIRKSGKRVYGKWSRYRLVKKRGKK